MRARRAAKAAALDFCRQAHAAFSVDKHRAVDVAHRDALYAFEQALVKGDDAWNYTINDKAARTVIDACKERIKGKGEAELKRVRELGEVTRGELAVLCLLLTRAEKRTIDYIFAEGSHVPLVLCIINKDEHTVLAKKKRAVVRLSERES